MLNQQTIASIAGLLKIDPAAFTAAIKDEKEVSIKVKGEGGVEVDFTGAGLHVLTETELQTRDSTVKEAAKSGFMTAGREIAIKEIKEKLGVTVEGKDVDKVSTAIKEKLLADANMKPDAKVKELEDQISLLKQNTGASESKLAELQRQLETERLDKAILSSLPARNSDISDSDYLILVKSRIQPETVDGKIVYKNAAGEVIRDGKTAVPKDLSGVLSDVFAASPAWAPKEPSKQGRGGGNSGSGGSGGSGGGGGDTPTSYSEALAAWEGEGKNANAAEFSTYVTKLQTDNKDFVMDLDKVPQ